MNAHIDIPRDELRVALVQRADMVERAAVKACWNYTRRSGDREFEDCGIGMMNSRLCVQTNDIFQSSSDEDQHG